MATTKRLAELLDDGHDFQHNDSLSALTLMNEIRLLGLAENVAELDILGYTVIPPEKVATPDFITRLREAILDVAERRHGERPVIEAPDDAGAVKGVGQAKGPFQGFGHPLRYLLLEDPVFQEAALNPTVTAITSYLVGLKSHIFGCVGYLKEQGNDDLFLHTDMAKIPSPYPDAVCVCTATWVLSDYSLENGSIAVVPGSHRRRRPPKDAQESMGDRQWIDAPAGSLIIHNGYTWHGAFARTAPGLRASMIQGFSRSYITPHEDYRGAVTPEILARHPRRFAVITDQDNNMPWNQAGPAPQNDLEHPTERNYLFGRSAYD